MSLGVFSFVRFFTYFCIMKHVFRLMAVFAMLAMASYIEMTACTSAIVSAKANPYGRPMLWKHRDTSTKDNKWSMWQPRTETTHTSLFSMRPTAGWNRPGLA